MWWQARGATRRVVGGRPALSADGIMRTSDEGQEGWLCESKEIEGDRKSSSRLLVMRCASPGSSAVGLAGDVALGDLRACGGTAPRPARPPSRSRAGVLRACTAVQLRVQEDPIRMRSRGHLCLEWKTSYS
jgi:hypothetical protein